MMNVPYFIKVFEYSKSEKKYKYERAFFPGTIELKYAENVVCGGTKPGKKIREKGFFNPFSENFLKTQESIIHYSYVANIVAAEMEKSIMAKHKYEELEVDEHNLAIHWRERDGDEYWGINEYKPNGRIKDVHITHMYFPVGYVNYFDHKYEKARHVYYEYDEKFNVISSRIEDEE